jgi:hypothetical protein
VVLIVKVDRFAASNNEKLRILAVESLTKKFPKLLQPKYWKLTDCTDDRIDFLFDNTGEFSENSDYQKFTVLFETDYEYDLEYTRILVPVELLRFITVSEKNVIEDFLIEESKVQNKILTKEIKDRYL